MNVHCVFPFLDGCLYAGSMIHFSVIRIAMLTMNKKPLIISAALSLLRVLVFALIALPFRLLLYCVALSCTLYAVGCVMS